MRYQTDVVCPRALIGEPYKRRLGRRDTPQVACEMSRVALGLGFRGSFSARRSGPSDSSGRFKKHPNIFPQGARYVEREEEDCRQLMERMGSP